MPLNERNTNRLNHRFDTMVEYAQRAQAKINQESVPSSEDPNSKSFNHTIYMLEWLQGYVKTLYLGYLAESFKAALVRKEKPMTATDMYNYCMDSIKRWDVPRSTSGFHNQVEIEKYEALKSMADTLEGFAEEEKEDGSTKV